VVLVLLLELLDKFRGAWKALLVGFDRQRAAAGSQPESRSNRRAF
jgi:hypothetical protein